jgi:hypothetical protein
MNKLISLKNVSKVNLYENVYVKNVIFNGEEVEIYAKGASRRTMYRHLGANAELTFILTPSECKELNLPVWYK